MSCSPSETGRREHFDSNREAGRSTSNVSVSSSRNTAGFKELLGPAAPNSSGTDEGADRDAPAASINV